MKKIKNLLFNFYRCFCCIFSKNTGDGDKVNNFKSKNGKNHDEFTNTKNDDKHKCTKNYSESKNIKNNNESKNNKNDSRFENTKNNRNDKVDDEKGKICAELSLILKQKQPKKVKFSTTPFVFYVKKNIDFLLNNVIEKLNKNNFFPKVGIEIEFYSTTEIKDINKFFGVIYDFANKNNISLQNIEKERGYNQFEIQFNPYDDLKLLVRHYENLKFFLLGLEDYNLTFEARPFYYDVGSALQVNLSLFDDENNNLFAKIEDDGEKIESGVLKNCVAGILEKTNIFLPFYTTSKNCLTRYDLDFCEIFYSMGKMPSPVFNCWGINNRTCSIRIPTPKNFNDFENYETESKKNRRIEFRVPSANGEIKLILYGVFTSILYGMDNNLEPPEPTTNNVLKDNFGYRAILDEVE